MLLAKTKIGSVEKENGKYIITIIGNNSILDENEWKSLLSNISPDVFPGYLSAAHPDIRIAIRHNEGELMGEFLELIEKAFDEES